MYLLVRANNILKDKFIVCWTTHYFCSCWSKWCIHQWFRFRESKASTWMVWKLSYCARNNGSHIYDSKHLSHLPYWFEPIDIYATEDITIYIEVANCAFRRNNHDVFQVPFQKFEGLLTLIEISTLVKKGSKKTKQWSFRVSYGLCKICEKVIDLYSSITDWQLFGTLKLQ